MFPPTGDPNVDAALASGAQQQQRREDERKLARLIRNEVEGQLTPLIQRLDELEARLDALGK